MCGVAKIKEARTLRAPTRGTAKRLGKGTPSRARLGACFRRLFPFVKISGFLVEQADATQNINCYIMTTDAAMIGRADFMPSAKGVTGWVMFEKWRRVPAGRRERPL